MIDADAIRSIAAVFEQVGASKSEEELAALTSEAPADSFAGKYFALLEDLDHVDVPVACRDIGFFRFFVVNGLLQAQRMRHEHRMFVLRAVGVGLHEFAEYLADRSSDGKRFFAFCIAQLIECGFEMDGLLMTMKGDARDQADAYELRRLREDGPDAFADSYLFNEDEKKLWNDVFDKGGLPAITALQRHFIDTYQVPFVPAPEGPSNA